MDGLKATLFFLVVVGGGSVLLAYATGYVLMLLGKAYHAIGNPGKLLRDEGPRPRASGPGKGYYDNPGGPG